MVTKQDLKNATTRLVVFDREQKRVLIRSYEQYRTLKGRLAPEDALCLELSAEYNDKQYVSYVEIAEKEYILEKDNVMKLAGEMVVDRMLRMLNGEKE